MSVSTRCRTTRGCRLRVLILLVGVCSLVVMNVVFWNSNRTKRTPATSSYILNGIFKETVIYETDKTTVFPSMSSFTIDFLYYNTSFAERAAPQTCSYRRHLAFIKVHKAGSSSISNVIFRFGVTHNLTFLLPREGVIVSYVQDKPWNNIHPAPEGKKFEILCSHSVYSKEEITRLLPPDTVYLAIVREPFSHLNSIINYIYGSYIPGSKKVRDFLKRPEFYNALDINRQRALTNNSMSYELGLKPMDFFNKDKIRKHLRTIDKEFALVIIMERMEESLILLHRYLCWNLTDVLFIKRNVNKLKREPEGVTEKLRKRHAQMNMADYMLYAYFYKKLQRQIEKEGTDFDEELMTYKILQERLRLFCLSLDEPRRPYLFLQSTRWSNELNISKLDCKPFLFDGLGILNYVKQIQYLDVQSNTTVE